MAKYFTQEQIEEFVERSRTAQGLPPKVTDPTVLRKVAILLGGPTERKGPKSSSYGEGYQRNKSRNELTQE